MACIRTRSCSDWCHICGRVYYRVVDVWYPQNAERDLNHGIDTSLLPHANYVRICKGCATEMALTADYHE